MCSGWFFLAYAWHLCCLELWRHVGMPPVFCNGGHYSKKHVICILPGTLGRCRAKFELQDCTDWGARLELNVTTDQFKRAARFSLLICCSFRSVPNAADKQPAPCNDNKKSSRLVCIDVHVIVGWYKQTLRNGWHRKKRVATYNAAHCKPTCKLHETVPLS